MLPPTILKQINLDSLNNKKFTVPQKTVEELELKYRTQAKAADVPNKFKEYVQKVRRLTLLAFSLQSLLMVVYVILFIAVPILAAGIGNPSRINIYDWLTVIGLLTFMIVLLSSRMQYYNKIKKIHLYFEDYQHGEDFVWPIEDVLDPKKKWEVYRVWDVDDFYIVQLSYMTKILYLTGRYVLYLPKEYLSDEEKMQLDIIYKRGINEK